MGEIARMKGSEVRFDRVERWYQVLPDDVKRAIGELVNPGADRDAAAQRLADELFAKAIEKDYAGAGAVLVRNESLVRELGTATRVRILSVMSDPAVRGDTNVFSMIEKSYVPDRSTSTEVGDAEDSDAGDTDSTSGDSTGPSGPSAALFDVIREDLRGLERMAAARMVRGTSARRTVGAIIGGIEDFERNVGMSKNGAFS